MIEAMKQALEALKNNKRTHYYCEDTWYSCPKHEDGCANDSEGDDCNCGADKANAEIDDAITALRQAIAEAEKQERYFCERCGKRLSGGIHTCTPPAEAEKQETNQVTLTQTNVGIGERGMQAYEAAKKRGWVGLSDERLMKPYQGDES